MKTNILRLALTLIIGALSVSHPLAAGVKPGEVPPPLQLYSLLQAPEGTKWSWDSLKGKIVILEFWATWCGPCVAAFPHLNELATQFKDKPVQFIAITEEDPSIVKLFLKKKPLNTWIGIDPGGLTAKAYGVTGIPHTVIVNQDGKIAGITFPTFLKAQHLNDLLARKMVEIPPAPASSPGEKIIPGELPNQSDGAADALFYAVIRPSKGNERRSTADGSKGSLTYLGMDLQSLLSTGYQISGSRLVIECELPTNRFDVAIKVPGAPRRMNESLRWVLENSFGTTHRNEKREADVYVLRASDEAKQRLQPSTPGQPRGSTAMPGKVQSNGMTVEFLAYMLEGLVTLPVVNETGLEGLYEIDLEWKADKDPEVNRRALFQAVRSQLGCELVPAKRSIDKVIVSKP